MLCNGGSWGNANPRAMLLYKCYIPKCSWLRWIALSQKFSMLLQIQKAFSITYPIEYSMGCHMGSIMQHLVRNIQGDPMQYPHSIWRNPMGAHGNPCKNPWEITGYIPWETMWSAMGHPIRYPIGFAMEYPAEIPWTSIPWNRVVNPIGNPTLFGHRCANRRS